MDPATRICRGCLRTIEEIAGWYTASPVEKRAILASWASDAAAVTSCPSLRAIPGAKSVVSIDDILEAELVIADALSDQSALLQVLVRS